MHSLLLRSSSLPGGNACCSDCTAMERDDERVQQRLPQWAPQAYRAALPAAQHKVTDPPASRLRERPLRRSQCQGVKQHSVVRSRERVMLPAQAVQNAGRSIRDFEAEFLRSSSRRNRKGLRARYTGQSRSCRPFQRELIRKTNSFHEQLGALLGVMVCLHRCCSGTLANAIDQSAENGAVNGIECVPV